MDDTIRQNVKTAENKTQQDTAVYAAVRPERGSGVYIIRNIKM
jgi:hypothetical protein